MHKEVSKLLEDIGEVDEEIYNKLVSIAHKTAKRKKYLVIDVMEMESIVNEDKVEPISSLDRVEVDV